MWIRRNNGKKKRGTRVEIEFEEEPEQEPRARETEGASNDLDQSH